MAFVNENIKILRNRMGITQERFAELIGINRKAVGAYEENRATPPLDKLNRMSKLFGVTIDELTHRSFEKGTPIEEAPEQEESSPLINPQVSNPERKKPFSRTGGQINIFEEQKTESIIRYVSHRYFDKYVLDAEFEGKISQMPFVSFPQYESEKTLRAFDVPVESYLDKGMIIGERLNNFSEIIDSQYHLVVSSKIGMFFKRLLKQNGEVLVQGDQRGENDFTLSISEIKEIWKPVGFFSTELPKEQVNVASLSSKINALKSELDKLL